MTQLQGRTSECPRLKRVIASGFYTVWQDSEQKARGEQLSPKNCTSEKGFGTGQVERLGLSGTAGCGMCTLVGDSPGGAANFGPRANYEAVLGASVKGRGNAVHGVGYAPEMQGGCDSDLLAQALFFARCGEGDGGEREGGRV